MIRSPDRVTYVRGHADESVHVMRRNRSQAAPAPDPALMALVETAGARARAAATFQDAIAAVLEDVANTVGWKCGHAWVTSEAMAGTWVSSGLWFPDDGIGLGGLRHACVEAQPFPARGHLALALHLGGTQWVGDLSGLTGTPLHDAAHTAGVVAAVACPVYGQGHPIAILEWYLATSDTPSADIPNALGHLSSVLSEVAERPVRRGADEGTYLGVRETVRWVTEEGVVSRVLTC